MPTSEKQIAANRRNAQKSTGPRTPAGKRASRRNALKHGILSRSLVLEEDAEARDEFDALLYALVADLEPRGALEQRLVEQIAVSYWRLGRVLRAEMSPDPTPSPSAVYALKPDNQRAALFQRSPHGREWLITVLREACDQIDRTGHLQTDTAELLYSTYGAEHSDLSRALFQAFQATYRRPSADYDPAHLRELLHARAQDLATGRFPLPADDAPKPPPAPAPLPDPRRLDTVLRYEKAIMTTLHRSLDELARRQRLRQAR